MVLPLIVAVLILGLAYLVFYVAPAILDFGKSFMAVVVTFLILFIGAAFYVVSSLPGASSLFPTTHTSDTSISVSDVVVKN
jgi:hypothetical protein